MRGNNDQQFNQILTSSIGQSSTYVIFHDYTSLLTNEEAHFKTRPSILVLNRLLPETSVQIKRWEPPLIAQFRGRYCKHNNATDSRESHNSPFKDYYSSRSPNKKRSVGWISSESILIKQGSITRETIKISSSRWQPPPSKTEKIPITEKKTDKPEKWTGSADRSISHSDQKDIENYADVYMV